MKILVLAAALLLLGFAIPAQAGEDQRHHAALFVGNTHTYDDEDGLTIGVEYEYRVMPEFGVGHDFHAGDWSLTPAFNVDFVDGEENLVFGVAFGRGF